jgi:hypothetical protein
MRITINLPEALLAQLKKRAAESGTTPTALIEDALREGLARRRRRPQARQVQLTTYGAGGLQPGVDLDNTTALSDCMESPGIP